MSEICLTKTQSIHAEIMELIKAINPLDALEAKHQQESLAWMASTQHIFRIQKPDVPNKHLVSYCVIFDPSTQQLLLADHIKAELWLPTGGHVDPGEHPTQTAARECYEELQLKADFLTPQPIFITSTLTTGLVAGHTDVSLWYVLRGDANTNYTYDPQEFRGICWFPLDDLPYDHSDPHMRRFVQKLQSFAERFR